jgi:WD40 repeat protein
MTSLKLLSTQVIAPASGGAQSLAFSPDGKLLAVANSITPPAPNGNGKVLLFAVDQSGPPSGWHLNPPLLLGTGASGTGYANAIAFSEKGGLLATANCVDGSVSLFSPLNHTGAWAPVPGSPFLIQPIRDQSTWIDPNALAFAPEETRTANTAVAQLATANFTNSVSLFSASSAGGLTAQGLPRATNAGGVTSTGAWGVAFNYPRTINVDTPLLLATANWGGDAGGSTSLFWISPTSKLVTGSPFSTGGLPPPKGNNNARSVAFSPKPPKDNLLAVAINGSGVALMVAPLRGSSLTPAVHSPFPTASGGSVETAAVAFSPDGTLLAAATTDVDITHSIFKGGVSLFEVTPGSPGLTLVPGSPFSVSPTYANSVAFSPDGKLLAVASGVGFSNNGSVSLFLVG